MLLEPCPVQRDGGRPPGREGPLLASEEVCDQGVDRERAVADPELALVVSRPKPELEPDGEGFDMSSLSTAQLRRYLSLTEEDFVERLEEDTLAEQVERVVDVAERFMADPRDVSPAEVTEAKAMLTSMRHYDRALAPIRRLHTNWRVPREHEGNIPSAPRSLE